MYEFKDEYLVGVDFIDDDHRKLFELTDHTYELMHEEFIVDKYDHVHAILHELKDYADGHFTREEAYMESINYKDLFTQKVEHAAFMKKINDIDIDGLDEGQEETIEFLVKFLGNWLIKHITENDKLIGA